MNEATYNLLLAELRAAGEAFDKAVADVRTFRLPEGNGTLREDSDYVEREFRDRL